MIKVGKRILTVLGLVAAVSVNAEDGESQSIGRYNPQIPAYALPKINREDIVSDLSPPVEVADIIIGPCFQMSVGNDFEIVVYDFKKGRSGIDWETDTVDFLEDVTEVLNDWRPIKVARYYRSKTCYACRLMIPPIPSSIAPSYLWSDDGITGNCWLAHYKTKLMHPEEITFRFRGMGDDILVVYVDGEVVLSACNIDESLRVTNRIVSWSSSSPESRKYYMGHHPAEVGDWITLNPDEVREMDIFVGKADGDIFSAMLAVEVKGEEYIKGPQGNPILPLFTTDSLSYRYVDYLQAHLVPGEICITNGPVFNDYRDSFEVDMSEYNSEVAPVVFADPAESPQINIEVSVQNTSANNPSEYVLNTKLSQTPSEEHNQNLAVTVYVIGKENNGDNYVLLERERDRFNPAKEDGWCREFEPVHIQTYDRTIPVRDGVFGQPCGEKYYGYLLVAEDDSHRIIAIKASHGWLLDIVGPIQVLSRYSHFNKEGVRKPPPRPNPIGVY